MRVKLLHGRTGRMLLAAGLSVLFLLAVSAQLLAAPPGPIKGRVVDQSTGKPIAGVSVTIKGIRGGVTTNEDGWFNVTIPADKAVLVFSSIGYATTEQSVEGNTADLVISLSQDTKGMGEVIVTALGITRSVKSLTYAAQRVGGDALNELRDASFANTL